MRSAGASLTRPARPMAIATPSRSATTGRRRSGSGSDAPTMAPCPASSGARSPHPSSSMPSRGSAACASRSPEPPHVLKASTRQSAAAAAPSAQGCPEDGRRRGRDLAQDRLSAGRRAGRSRPATEASRGGEPRPEGAGRRAAVHLDRQRRADRGAGQPAGDDVDAGRRRLRAGLGDRCQGRERQRGGAARMMQMLRPLELPGSASPPAPLARCAAYPSETAAPSPYFAPDLCTQKALRNHWSRTGPGVLMGATSLRLI